MTNRFEGKTAIVTGGSGGIGAAIVERLLSEGAHVAMADLAAPGTSNDALFYRRTDVSDETEVAALVAETVRRFGRLDILINNAGIGALVETPEMTAEVWRRTLRRECFVGVLCFPRSHTGDAGEWRFDRQRRVNLRAAGRFRHGRL